MGSDRVRSNCVPVKLKGEMLSRLFIQHNALHLFGLAVDFKKQVTRGRPKGLWIFGLQSVHLPT